MGLCDEWVDPNPDGRQPDPHGCRPLSQNRGCDRLARVISTASAQVDGYELSVNGMKGRFREPELILYSLV